MMEGLPPDLGELEEALELGSVSRGRGGVVSAVDGGGAVHDGPALPTSRLRLSGQEGGLCCQHHDQASHHEQQQLQLHLFLLLEACFARQTR
jgi:hypothetical protein